MQDEFNNFWINLEKIQNVLLKSDEEFAEYLGLRSAQFLKLKKTKSLAIPMNCVFEFAERLNFHFEDLLSDNFKTNSIETHILGKTTLLDKYSIATYSKTRQSGNVLNYLERTRGERSKINLLRKFQLSEEFIFSGKNLVNIHLLTDITTYLQNTYKFSDKEFFEIGQATPFTSMNNDLSIALSDKKDIFDTLNFFVDELSNRFDENYSYRILKIEGDYVYIEAAPNKHVVEELKLDEDQFGNELTCLTRMGVISSITWFKYRSFANVQKISSIYAGDRTHIYKFDISQFKFLKHLYLN